MLYRRLVIEKKCAASQRFWLKNLSLQPTDIRDIYTNGILLGNPLLMNFIPANDCQVSVCGDEFELIAENGKFKIYSELDQRTTLNTIIEWRREIAEGGYTRSKIERALKLMSRHGVYYRPNNDNTGESVCELLCHKGNGFGHCIAIAKLVKALVPECHCVRGKINGPFSLFGNEDEGHIFNCYRNENGQLLFFDACSVMRTANGTVIQDEISRKHFRKDYSDGVHRPIVFYTKEYLKKFYSFDEEKIWF